MNNSPRRHLWVWYTPCGLGGVETFLLQMAREYARCGRQMVLAGVQSCEGPLKGALEATGAELLDWSGFYPAYMKQAPAEDIQRRILGQLVPAPPELIVLNGCTDFGTGIAPLLDRAGHRFPVVDIFHIDPPDDGYLRLRRPYVKLLDGLVSSNAFTCERFSRVFPSAKQLPSRYIPYAAAVPTRSRREPDDTLRLLYVGRLVQEQKRILEIPRLMHELRRAGRKFRLTMVGDGSEAAQVKQLLAGFELLDQVELVGYVPPNRIMDYFFDHDVLINVSNYEGFSISVIEALAAGCVPVCTRLPGLDPQVFVDGVTCRLFPIEDVQQMVPILAGLTPQDIRGLSREAGRVGGTFTVERMSSAYFKFFDELVAGRRAEGGETAAVSRLPREWDLSRHNPWLPHPHPVKRWLRGLLGRPVA